jgi:hypothetical protein
MKPCILLLSLPFLLIPSVCCWAQEAASPKSARLESAWSQALPLGQSQTSLPAIIVWRIGSPHRGDTPDTSVPLDLEADAEKLGYNLKVESFPADDFAEMLLDAFKKNREPDILCIDNYGLIEGIKTDRGRFIGIAANEQVRQSLIKVTESFKVLERPRDGWEFLFRTSRNFEAARALALRSVECNQNPPSPSMSEAQTSLIERLAQAFMEGPEASAAFRDPDSLEGAANQIAPGQVSIKTAFRSPGPGNSKGVNPDLLRLHVRETRACGYWGNDHLAFASALSTYATEKSVGRLPELLVLRKLQGQWKILVASTDVHSNTAFLREVPKLASLLQSPWTSDNSLLPAKILAPEDGKAPASSPGERDAKFEWQPGESVNRVAEIIEFAFRDDDWLIVKFTSGSSTSSEQLAESQLWFTGTLWRWRVWSISNSGGVSFSESRSLPH